MVAYSATAVMMKLGMNVAHACPPEQRSKAMIDNKWLMRTDRTSLKNYDLMLEYAGDKSAPTMGEQVAEDIVVSVLSLQHIVNTHNMYLWVFRF